MRLKTLEIFLRGKEMGTVFLDEGHGLRVSGGDNLKKIDCVIENSSFSVRILERPLNFCVTRKNLVCVYCKKVFFILFLSSAALSKS